MDAAVIEVLERAGSQDPNIFKPAEQTLREWETQRGFYSALYNAFCNHSLAVNVRWMAILCFKTGVDRYWRRTAPGAIAQDEKEYLKQQLIANFDEPVNQLAVQLATVIAKVARVDSPKEWCSLIPTLLEGVRSQNPLTQHRALLTLHHVVKMLASKRLQLDRNIFRELAANMFGFIHNLCNTYTECFLILAANGAEVNRIQDAMEKALLLLKILGKLVLFGFEDPSKSLEAMFFLNAIFQRAKACLECRKTLVSRGVQMEVCDKFIIHLTKIALLYLQLHPPCYVELIPASLEFSVFYCFTEAGQAVAFEKLIIQCLNLMKNVLLDKDFTRGYWYRSKAVATDPCTQRANQLIQDFFTPETLTEICFRLVTHYFLLTASDLELWDSDPENFVVDDYSYGTSFKYSLRSCVESVFMAILRRFRGVPTTVLMDLIQQHHQPVNPSDLHAIILKDAVYNAVGLAAFDLYDEVNFDQWFSTTLKEELKIRSNNYRIIRRRVYWLIGRWTNVKLSAELRPELYKLMVEALSPEEDLGVRLAASDVLKLAIDDFQFNPIEFAPFLEPAFSLLFSLLKEVKECDTKMRVLYVLSFMIERVGSNIKPYSASLITYLPALWQQSEDHNMLRCAVVSTLVHLEKALGTESHILQPFVVDVVALSCDVNQDSHVYLLVDGLELWSALVENASSPTPVIMDLFRLMPALLEHSTENLRLCSDVIEAYLFLSPEEFITQRGPIVIETLRGIFNDLRAQDLVTVMTIFETFLKVSPQHGTSVIKPILPDLLVDIYEDDIRNAVAPMYFSVVARVLLSSTEMFIGGIIECTKRIEFERTPREMPLSETLEMLTFTRIILNWVEAMSRIVDRERCKLLAIALCTLLNANYIANVPFSKIITCIVETLNDITDVDDIEDALDSLMIADSPGSSEYDDLFYDTKNKQRRITIAARDPVHSVSLKHTLRDHLLSLQRVIGEKKFKQLMKSLNSKISSQLKHYISI